MLRAIMMKKNHSEEYQRLWNDNIYNRGPLISLIAVRIILCTALVMIPVTDLLNVKWGLAVAIAIAMIAMMIFSKKLKMHSIALEKRFLSNLSARDIENERKAPIKQRFANSLLQRDLHLADFEVAQNSPSVGHTLRELDFRKKCDVNVVTIIRGEDRINIPGGDERIYPFDKLVVVGTDKDLIKFRQYIEERNKSALSNAEKKQQEVNIEQIMVTPESHLSGKSILESGIRDKAGCLVVGIERGETSIQNPIPSTVMMEGDIVWIVGEHDKVLQLGEGI
jgi:CPA2 family monovalent cation:H+ antiporter-2